MSITTLQLHKRASYEFRFIQDKYFYSSGDRCCAIADGTTQSFYSERWAELITRQFVQRPTFDSKELLDSFRKAAEQFKELQFPFSPNPALASLEKAKQKKGATATFTGIRMEQDGILSIIACGDSNVFLIRDGQLQGFPFNSVEDLDQNSSFLNTEKILSGEVDDSLFCRSKIILEKGDTIILATDALSRLLLNYRDRYKEILSIQNFEGLYRFCVQSWMDRTLEEDDITAVIINDFLGAPLEVLPPDGFSFPKEDEVEFAPALPNSNYNELTDQEMQHLNNSFQQLSNEVHQLKKKTKNQEMLLIIAIGLILVNLFFFFNQKTEQPQEQATSRERQLELRVNEQEEKINKQNVEIKRLKSQLENRQASLTRDESGDTGRNFVTSTVNDASEGIKPATTISGRAPKKAHTKPGTTEKKDNPKEEPAKPTE